MYRMLLIRHGATDLMSDRLCGRMPGVPLNSEGRSQAETLGRSLREEVRLAAVYSSPMERAVETARYVAEPQGLSIAIEEGVNELDFGDWMGLSFQDLHGLPDWKEYNRRRALHPAPDGESLLEVQARAWKSLSTIVQNHSNETIAVVTHGDVIRALVILFLGMSLDNILRLAISPASATAIDFNGGGATISYLNRVFGGR